MVVRGRGFEIDVAVWQHPYGAIGVLWLELHLPAILEVHEHVIFAVFVVTFGIRRTAAPVLLLLSRLASLGLTGGGASLLSPRLMSNEGELLG